MLLGKSMSQRGISSLPCRVAAYFCSLLWTTSLHTHCSSHRDLICHFQWPLPFPLLTSLLSHTPFSLTGTHSFLLYLLLILTWVTLTWSLRSQLNYHFLGNLPKSTVVLWSACVFSWPSCLSHCLPGFIWAGSMSHFLRPPLHRVMSGTWWTFNKYLFNI